MDAKFYKINRFFRHITWLIFTGCISIDTLAGMLECNYKLYFLRNTELERKQRKFDVELNQAQQQTVLERQLKEKLSAEKVIICIYQLDKFSLN